MKRKLPPAKVPLPSFGSGPTERQGQAGAGSCCDSGHATTAQAGFYQPPVHTVFVVGAGFSHYAGLPLQCGFTKAILSAETFKESKPSRRIVEYLKPFVDQTFGARPNATDPGWPDLEDIFTCVDLSANSGHHLGQSYSPAELRTVRRALIARTIWMLTQEYENVDKSGTGWQTLNNFLQKINTKATAFVSLNWDVALEHRITDIHPEIGVSYGQGVTPADFPDAGHQITVRRPVLNSSPFRVIKIHGSINWLYCDNCREVFWFPPEKSSIIGSQVLRPDDRKRIGHFEIVEWTCHRCMKVSLSTRLATFSYTKALDYPMFQTSWRAAQFLLRDARRWVFIGYSLPPADYEFKYLLKWVQLSRRDRPELFLVAGGDAAENTRKNYQRFFGSEIKAHLAGLTPNVIDEITCIKT